VPPTPHTNVVGVFDDHHHAGAAVEELRQAGFTAAPLDLPALATEPGNTKPVAVTVQAEGRHPEAVAVLEQHGAEDVQTVAR
jgi:hypothetical protein